MQQMQEHDLAPIPEGGIILGTADGITFALVGNTVWMCGYRTWRVLCTAAQWPYTASCAAVADQQPRESA